MLRPVRDSVRKHHDHLGAEATIEMEWEAVKLSLANLRTFPFIADREKDGRLKLHGAHFAIAEGQLYLLDEAEGSFRPVS
jgi:carbonic anhydrase